MAYIAPNSVIKFCTDVGCESSYTHTILFTTLSNQLAFFNSRVKPNSGGYSFTLNSQSYQRFGKNKMRVAIPVEQLYDCSYIMFQNTSYSNKWFFAFITGLEYVNNETSEVTYQLDVIQSFMFKADGSQGWRLSSCFIERQHTNDDTVGSNTVPENLELGDYFYSKYTMTDNPFETWYIIVATTYGSTTSSPFPIADGVLFNNVYSGLDFKLFPATQAGVASVNAFLKAVTSANASDGVVSVFMYPYDLLGQVYHDSKSVLLSNTKPTSLGSYTPKNKKLLTYPYTMLYVTDNNGTSSELKYEYFSNATNWYYRVSGALSCAPEIMGYPAYYKGLNTSANPNAVNERMLMGNLPQCAYAIDSYRAWLALSNNRVQVQHDITNGRLDMAGGAIGLASNALILNASGAYSGFEQMVSGNQLIESTLARVTDASTTPPQARSMGSGVVLAGTKNLEFAFYNAYIRPEFAKIIDDYFDMYGYATHKLGVPDISCRAGWNYVKTVGCLLGGSIPAFAEEEIARIFDRGITFWHRPTRVGDYTQDNSIVTTGGT